MITRRQILKWIPPVVVVVSLPAHAQTTQVDPEHEVGPDIPPPPPLGPQPPFQVGGLDRQV
jgi:hypothetical protein